MPLLKPTVQMHSPLRGTPPIEPKARQGEDSSRFGKEGEPLGPGLIGGLDERQADDGAVPVWKGAGLEAAALAMFD